MKTAPLLIASAFMAGCASQPQKNETVWVNVVEVYTPASLQQSFNRALHSRFQSEGITQQDIEDGRVARVACGLGSDYAWGSYALLPPGLRAVKNQVLQLDVVQTGTDERMPLNRVIRPVPNFDWPGTLPAYRFIPDWRERNLSRNIERIPLAPAQQGRYVVSHSWYLIRCRQ